MAMYPSASDHPLRFRLIGLFLLSSNTQTIVLKECLIIGVYEVTSQAQWTYLTIYLDRFAETYCNVISEEIMPTYLIPEHDTLIGFI